jgi:hypothetical protein
MNHFVHTIFIPPLISSIRYRSGSTADSQFPHYFPSHKIASTPPGHLLLFFTFSSRIDYRYMHRNSRCTTDDGSDHDNHTNTNTNTKSSNGSFPQRGAPTPGASRPDERNADICTGDIIRVSITGFDYRGGSDGREMGV